MDPHFAKLFCRPDFIPRLMAGDPLIWGCVVLAGVSAIAAAVKEK